MCSCEVLVFLFSPLFFTNTLFLFMSLQIKITFPLKKNHIRMNHPWQSEKLDLQGAPSTL